MCIVMFLLGGIVSVASEGADKIHLFFFLCMMVKCSLITLLPGVESCLTKARTRVLFNQVNPTIRQCANFSALVSALYVFFYVWIHVCKHMFWKKLKQQIPLSFHVMFIINITWIVLFWFFLKTYVCKHESKHNIKITYRA